MNFTMYETACKDATAAMVAANLPSDCILAGRWAEKIFLSAGGSRKKVLFNGLFFW